MVLIYTRIIINRLKSFLDRKTSYNIYNIFIINIMVILYE